MAEKPDKSSLVHVEIFGQSYAVRAGAEPGYVEQLAAYVDEKMRETSRAGGAVDSVRIAVLAALNISDEYFRLRSETQKGGDSFQQRAARLARELAAVVDE
jgi:cell division protein ZapA